ncbi:MAG: guanylate kinase [Alphaproteobacteria bacterium]
MMPAKNLPPAATQPLSALKRRGVMLVLASPPGGGKTTISREISKRDAETVISVSATTRKQRPGEVEGQHYYFVSKEKFEEMIKKGDMLEHALVYNNYFYGTPRKPVEKALTEGRDVLFDIDWQGNRSLAKVAPNDVVSVFLLPPSWDELAHRLHNRAQDSEEEIVRRLTKARDEIAHYSEFQYVLVNRDFEESVAAVTAILQAERQKRDRLVGIQSFVDTLKPGK